MIIRKGETNWSYILIIFIVAAVAGGGILGYRWWIQKKVAAEPEIEIPPKIEIRKPHIQVVSPNGGEQLIKGNTYTIQWNAKELAAGVIDISLVDVTDSKDIRNIVIAQEIPGYVGNYSWNLPLDIDTGDDYKISVYESPTMVATPRLSDKSDDFFTIIEMESAVLKNYIKEQYKFEIDWPQDCEIEIRDHRYFCPSSAHNKCIRNIQITPSLPRDYYPLYIVIHSNPDGYSTLEWLDENMPNLFSQPSSPYYKYDKEIRVGERDAVRLRTTNGAIGITTFMSKSTFLIQISTAFGGLGGHNGTESVYEHILSSFKFLD